jgi:hypothetical protein
MWIEVVVKHDDCVGGSEVCEKREAIRTSSVMQEQNSLMPTPPAAEEVDQQAL